MTHRQIILHLFLHGVWVFLFPLAGFTQAPDSLLAAYRDAGSPDDRIRATTQLARHYLHTHMDSASSYIDLGRAHLPKLANDTLLVQFLETTALVYKNQSQLPAALSALHSGLHAAKRMPWPKFIDQLYLELGRTHHLQSDYDSAVYYAQLVIGRMEQAGHAYELWKPYQMLGMIHSDLQEWPVARSYFDRALEAIYLKSNSPDRGFLQYLVMDYAECNQDIPYYSRIRNEYLRDRTLRGKPLMDAHHMLLKSPEMPPAETRRQILKYLPVYLQNKDHFSACEAYFQLGRTYVAEDRVDEAVNAFQSIFPISEQLGVPTLTHNVHLALFTTYEAAGRPTEAIPHLRQMLVLRDSILQLEKQDLAQDLTIKYQTAETEKALAEQKLLLEQATHRQRLLLILLLAAAGVIAAVALALRTKMRYVRQLDEKNKIILKALEEKDLLLREIHHRVKNNLQMISALLYLHGKSAEDFSAQHALMESQNRIQSMAIIHQDLYMGDNLLAVSVQSYMDKLLDHLINAYNIDPNHIHIEKKIQIDRLDVDTIVPLALIINELVSNALKHAFQSRETGAIGIQLYERDRQLILEVEDNGSGMREPVSAHSGNFGFKLIHILAERLGATLTFQQENGMRVGLTAPLPSAA